MPTILFAVWLIGALLMIALFLVGRSGKVSWLKAGCNYADGAEAIRELIICAVMWPVLLALGGMQWSFGKRKDDERGEDKP
jgi:hypothetical protein